MGNRSWALFLAASLVTCCLSLLAEAGEAEKFKKGDRVEVEHRGKMQQGVVLGIDTDFDRVEVLVDDDGSLPARMSAQMRNRVLTSSFRASEVRLLANEKADAAQSNAQSRVWKDRTGKFKITATYRGIRDGKVVLENEQGKEIQVPLEKLADEDAKFARELESEEDNPFAVATNEGVAPRGQSSSSANIAKAITKNAKMLQPKTFSSWTFKPEGKVAASNSQLSGQHIQLEDIPGSDRFFEKLEKMLVSDDGSRVLIIRQQGKVGDGEMFIQEINVATGVAGSLIPLSADSLMLDAWPNEELVALRPNHFGFGKNKLLTIAKMKDHKLVPVTSWMPYADQDWEPKRDIKDAWFLSSDRILTSNSNTEALTLWSISEASALLQIPIKSAHSLNFAFSTDHRILAIVMDEGIALIDTEAGTHVGTLETDGDSIHALAFKDDMQRLATYGDDVLSIWDLTTGNKVQTFWHPTMGMSPKVNWAGNFVVFNGRHVFDVDRRILLWEYKGGKRPLENLVIRNGRLYASAKPWDKSPATCFTAKLPHSAAIELASQLGSAEELLIAKPGDKMAVTVDVDPSIASPEEVRAAIVANVKEGGFEVAEQADLVITAVCQRKEQQTIKINTGRDYFRARPEDIVEKTITPHASFLRLTLKGGKFGKRVMLRGRGT